MHVIFIQQCFPWNQFNEYKFFKAIFEVYNYFLKFEKHYGNNIIYYYVFSWPHVSHWDFQAWMIFNETNFDCHLKKANLQTLHQGDKHDHKFSQGHIVNTFSTLAQNYWALEL